MELSTVNWLAMKYLNEYFSIIYYHALDVLA